jgi:tRNA 2-thiocytidine biosynthesis protein TtcA
MKIMTEEEKKNYRQGIRLEKRLRRWVGKAVEDYQMIQEGDRIMVCLSGGKDSYALLDLLLGLQRVAPVRFDVFAVNLDQKQPGFPPEVLPRYLTEKGIEYHIVEQDTYSIVKRVIPEGDTTCSLCSRLRRGILYKTAKRLGATKIALGHHREDLLETLMLNLFFGGTLKAMPPKLVSDNGDHVVIRPMVYCKEKEINSYAQWKEYPIIPCDLCGSQPNLKRAQLKAMMKTWDKQYPGALDNMLRAMSHVIPSHLMDKKLYDFQGVIPTGLDNPLGDKAFDEDCLPRELGAWLPLKP